MKDLLTIALSKGRLLAPSIRLLEKLGIRSPDLTPQTRRLHFRAKKDGTQILIIRAVDVPTYVEYGAADLGIAGQDLLLEQNKDVYEPLDLRFGKCRIVLAEPMDRAGRIARTAGRIRVATKYPVTTERFFSEKGLPVEVIKLYGSIELAPSVGLADQIVDLISTGQTLKENRLRVVEEIIPCSARLIVNRASLKLKYERVQQFIHQCKQAIEDIADEAP